MKLNKQQIEALASKFYNELITEYNKINEVFRNEQLKKFKPNYEKGIKLLKNNLFLKSIYIEIPNDDSAELKKDYTFKDFTDSYWIRNSLKDIERNIPSIETITNDIILATIDSTSVDEIMKNLKQKYK